ncbi:MAG: DNA methyltransferase [Prevotella nigrescens]
MSGNSTTGISANLFNRNYIGIDISENYLEISKKRYNEIQTTPLKFMKKISGVDLSVLSKLDL